MKLLHHTSTLTTLCKSTKKWGIYFNIFVPDMPGGNGFTEVIKAAPWIDLNNDLDNHMQSLGDGSGYLLFDSEKEMENIYYQTIGDDGPREQYTNKYNGPAKVYMLTCNPDGQTMNENT